MSAYALPGQTIRPPLQIWRRWTLATAAGELAGFAVPTLVGIAALRRFGEPRTPAAHFAFAALMVVAGMGEGAVLGRLQWSALRRAVPAVTVRAWVGATAIAAGVAWALAMTVVTLREVAALSPVALMVIAAFVSIPLLCSIGAGQWFVLRRSIPRAGWWVPANVIAWLAGLPVTFIAPALVPDGSPASAWIGAGIAGGLVMGFIVGAITGFALVRIIAAQPAGEDAAPTTGVPAVDAGHAGPRSAGQVAGGGY